MARSIRIESIGGGSRGVGGSVSRTVKTTKGKAKVNRRVNNINDEADNRTGGAFGYTYNKSKLKEVVDNSGTTKVKPRNLGKTLKQIAPSRKKEVKIVNKIIKNRGEAIKPNVKVNPRNVPKVPVKPKASRTRSGKKV